MDQHKRHLSHHHSEKEKTDKQADTESIDNFFYLVGALSPVNHKKQGQKIYFAQLHALLKWNSLFQWLWKLKNLKQNEAQSARAESTQRELISARNT